MLVEMKMERCWERPTFVRQDRSLDLEADEDCREPGLSRLCSLQKSFVRDGSYAASMCR